MATFDFPTKEGKMHTVTADRWRADGDEVVFEEASPVVGTEGVFRVVGRYAIEDPQRNVVELPTSYDRRG
ncbi:MAG: hypothetical protein JWL70_1630 [Acidimicrobiia bacterium]|nr:hypothetical protein [Acidimicrobiia bacterium]